MRVQLAAVVAVAAIAAAPSTATPERDLLIVPGQQIGKVRLGMSFAQVTRALGKPAGVNRRTRTAFATYVEYDWGYGRWTVGFSGRGPNVRVSLVATTIRRERTREGVGVGTRAARVASIYRNRGVRCETSLVAGRVSYGDSCRLSSRTGNVTYFAINFACVRPDASWPCPQTFQVYEVLVRSPSAPKPVYD